MDTKVKSKDPVGALTLSVMSEATYYNRWLFSQIRPFLLSPVVEVGAGIGNFLPWFIESGLKVTAVDYNLKYLDQIKKVYNIDTCLFDLQQTSTPQRLYQKFDSAVSLNVLEHIPNISQAMNNIYSMLKSGGVAVILVPSFNLAYNRLDRNLGHVKRYSIPEINSIAKRSGFKIVKSYYINPLGLMGWIVSGLILRKESLSSGPVKLFDIVSRPFLALERFIHPPIGISLITILKKP